MGCGFLHPFICSDSFWVPIMRQAWRCVLGMKRWAGQVFYPRKLVCMSQTLYVFIISIFLILFWMLSFLSAFFLSCRCSEPHKRCSFIFLFVCFSFGCILKNEVLLGWGNLTVSLTFVCVMVTYLIPEQGVRDCGVVFFFFEIFIYFWLCCAVSSAGEWGLLLVAVHRLLAAVPFLLLQNMGSRAQDQ